MQVLSGQSMSSLGGAGRLELAQQEWNRQMRSIVDNAAMQSSPRWQVTDTQIRTGQIKQLLNNLLPKVCHAHVYKCDHERSLVDNCEIVKWTFFNDLSVRLKVATNVMINSGDAEPIIDDFVCWQADAIMKCEAGDDVWPRPKPMESTHTPPGVSSLHAGQFNSQQQSGLASSINQQAVHSGFGLGGLFK